ncbi:hypothetical protein ZWY2020_014179 [Hordeum vulgare]|nr:hypothetical protein ZWY2020_014179 [Hordeum vulgare]
MLQLSLAMLRHLDHARRPRATRSVTIPSPAIDQAVFFLRSHAVTLTAADGVNATSPMAVGRALEGLLSVPTADGLLPLVAAGVDDPPGEAAGDGGGGRRRPSFPAAAHQAAPAAAVASSSSEAGFAEFSLAELRAATGGFAAVNIVSGSCAQPEARCSLKLSVHYA